MSLTLAQFDFKVNDKLKFVGQIQKSREANLIDTALFRLWSLSFVAVFSYRSVIRKRPNNLLTANMGRKPFTALSC